MRCSLKGCGHRLAFSFMDDVRDEPVYQCRAVGVTTTVVVQTARGVNTYLTHTLDHTDVFYRHDGLQLIQVKPIRLNKEISKTRFRNMGFPPYLNEKGEKEWPIAWTTGEVK